MRNWLIDQSFWLDHDSVKSNASLNYHHLVKSLKDDFRFRWLKSNIIAMRINYKILISIVLSRLKGPPSLYTWQVIFILWSIVPLIVTVPGQPVHGTPLYGLRGRKWPFFKFRAMITRMFTLNNFLNISFPNHVINNVYIMFT